MAINFYSHGACREVTGSKHFLEIDDKTIQIDCGMFQGKREEAYQKNKNLPFNPKQINAILLTHAHFDHSGALPLMIKNGFNGNIYSTSATRDISQIILLDSAYIQQKDAEYIQAKINKYPERGLRILDPLYSAEDTIDTMKNFVSIDYHRSFKPIDRIESTFFNSGHIMGSALVYLTIDDRINIGFSGDLGRRGLPIVPDPETLPKMDYLVLEGTYGNRLHDPIGVAKEELKGIINKAYSQSGKIIIPAFSIERTQELIYLIHIMQIDNEIPKIPIFIDSPMAINATSVFKIHPECFDSEVVERFTANGLDPFGFDEIHYAISTKESMEINLFKGPAIIISASGMAESGRILHHLANHVENPNNIVAIVGFMAEHTLGRKLVERQPQIIIFNKMYKLNAEVATLNAFSGHADYNEIIEWLSRHDVSSLKNIFLVHGEEEALSNLQSKLKSIGVKKTVIVDANQRYALS